MNQVTLSVQARRLARLNIISWALYDLANTVFSMNIISLYFSLWVVNVMGGTDADYGNANALSMLLMFLSAPILGALSDQVGRRMPFLVATSLLCVGFTAMLGVGSLTLSLLFFIIANYMFQAGLIFYDSLLPEVSTEENRGRIGGLGIGLGYMGSFIGVGSGLLLLDRVGYVGIFRLSALLFLVFAIPCFLFVREQPRTTTRITTRVVTGAVSQVARTVEHAREFPGLIRFLIGRIFYTDPVNTAVVFMGLYVTNEVGFSETQAQIVLLVAIVFAVVGGFAWGFVVDRIGPKHSLNLVLVLWMIVAAGLILMGLLDLPSILFWPIACLAGIALGGAWAADRPYMLRLSPPRYVGEFYGLYSMVGRFASITGPFLWGFIADTLGLGRPAAVASLLAMIVISFLILQGVDDRPRRWAPELLAQ
ncbi:MAG TPA: MFS transporter [Anaerolineae bacterium]|nr:MFS transporter [Anaerolineae bacterium]HIQ05589.1 MFS transporter [Anaerolineae bacterium]